MPINYCLCCAGHFRFHYQKALGIKLRVKKIVSSAFDSNPQYCSFIFEIIEKNKMVKIGKLKNNIKSRKTST